ncbi:Vacuolar protein sorting-associated protein 13D [Tupaia chinensis]|uniref:Vacuolar protein sorting-associated protein 13D n=1 Tax=Tupaia chinensis TaxID=246437 RepID=L9L0A0_TUPCH|nr:Vacuolar protein sorting-associated protein 13D [Tupaia chinensis]
MLEGLVAWVLNTYLGKYVNNLNTDQLSVALLKGAVELENLPLKKDALKELELPFEVKAGFIGKVTLQIPFYRPHVDPWNERQQKGESYWYSVTASVVTRIVENIELNIQDVHLRFEDGITNPSHPFAFGICIKNVSMQNAVNEPVQKLMRKKQLDVAEFSIYWDVDCTLLGDLPQVELQLQYRQIMEFLKELERKERQVKFRKWKPSVAVSKNCREWWYFALNANLYEIREQRKCCTWDFLLHRARDAVSYTDKYFRKLKGGLLSAEDKEEMCRIEEEQSFEELKILRELVHDRFHKQDELAESLREPQWDSPGDPPGGPEASGGSGMLQYLQSWFPGWGGWYGQPTPEGTTVEGLTAEQQEQWTPGEILGTEEFFDPTAEASCMNTCTKRDHVFAKLNLQLQRGTVTLLHKEQGTPQMNESAFMQLEFSAADPDDPVFEMLYERNPVHSHFERRLNVSTRPLNIIYNPQAIKKVADFFYKGKVHTSGFGYQSELELRVAEAARRQYNKLKMQTKAEIRQTLDRLLVGDFIEDSKRWTVRLDISAPQVIFPDDFKFKNPVLVVVDLGRMLLTNTQDDTKRKSGGGSASEENQFSDDEYKTPLATPPNTPPPETSSSNGEKTPPFSGVEFSEEQLQAHLMSTKMYERYSLSFMDLQIMVGRVKDNWKHVQDIDVGPTHVVEKFNVHLQLERRLIYTSDPKYPGAVLSGNLPDLKIHINEDKISALKNCFALLTTPEIKTSDTQIKEKIFPQEEQRGSLQDSVMNLTQSIVMLEQHTREVLVESQLLLAEFKVNCMQLGVESNGRYISVLKVFGTNAHFVKRPYDAEVSLTVHGLLLVDTMQTYGADFDLLMASHKNLSFDIPTGSLRDSRAQSPVSGPVVTHLPDATILNDRSATSVSLDTILTKEQESLIKLEYQFVSSECPSMNLDSTLQVISLQVNNLDIILNPETIVELIGFLQKSFPKDKDDLSPQPLMTDFERDFREQGTYQSTYEQNTEVAVEIHRLNLLLLRTVGMANGEKYGRKIATASIGGTKVNVSMGSTFDVNGSLGCLQLMDLTQDNVKNQYVVSIGNSTGYENIISDIGYFESVFVRMEDTALTEALSFTFVEKSKQECLLNLKMASLHYNHSAKFLKELTLSMDELEENFRNMLKSAATKVTTVLATKTAEYSEMVSLFETPRKTREPFILEENEIYGFGLAPCHSDTVKLILNINIESPVVSIPRKPGSPELLVGHLGQIFIQNFVAGDDESRSDRLRVEIKDIKLYSLNCTQLVGREGAGSEVSRVFGPPSGAASASSQEEAHFTRHDFFESLHRGQAFHILTDTTIQFKLEKIPIERESELTFSISPDDLETSSIMKIEGKFVNPVQVVLAKHVYEQVLQTLDNLVYSEDLNKFPASAASSPGPHSPLPSLSTCGEPSIERKENGLFSHSSFSNTSQKSLSVKEVKSFTQIQANFCISELQVQLSGDLTLGAQGLVSLKFQDFEVEFSKDHPQTLSIQIALRSLLMEDLLEKNPDSKYKNLMVSRGAPKPSSLAQKEYLSQSCPSVSNVEYPDMPRSLPSHMEEAPNVFQLYQRPTSASRKKQKEVQDKDYPLTPPPSPSVDEPKILTGKSKFDDSLVHINIFLVDKKHPEFSSIYNRVNRSIDVDFNCLDVLITLQTWVVILDFFGIGSTADNHAMKVPPEDILQNVKSESSAFIESELQDPVNTKLDLKVHSLSLVLNKTTSELAKANVSKLVAHLEMIEGDLALQGSIGSLSLSDLTSHGEFYRERFTTSGDEALIFQTFKYGRPDPLLRREHDIRVSLQMASVQYVHTQRFQAEVVAFIQHFTQLQDVLGRQRAAIEGQTVRDQAQRCSRVLLDIEAGAPVLLVPESSRSNNLIVANLGKLKVKNKFLFAGFPGTFSLQDKTVLSGEVYTCMCFLIDMVNVSLELKDPKGKEGAGSLARFDFKKCKLLYESFSNQTKSINLVSHSMMAFDTRYAGQKTSPGTTNVFNCIFQPSKNSSTTQGSIQIELHFRSTKDSSCFTVVLNNLRVFLIFDWLLLVHDFLHTPSDIKKQNATPSRHRNSSSESAVVPKTVKSGVVTKRSSLPVSNERHLEVKVNVTGTEFVVVEDVSCFDTNAIILKGTTVLTYKPRFVDRPFSGSLFGIEVFSCRLGNEHDTALSIIDPVQIQVELVGNSSYQNSSGLMDAFNSEDFPPILEIQLQALDIRLSYNDVQLFLAIAKSIPEQANAAVPDPAAVESASVNSCLLGTPRLGEEIREEARHTLDPVLELQLARLQELGFSMDDCRKALLVCQGQLKKAASWLFKNAEPLKSLSLASSSRDSLGAVPASWLSGVEIKAESVCICFIDDCMDCDVPLAELTFSRLNFLQHVRTSPEGYAHFTLSGDYYNRALSGWEPFIEPWPCSVSWQQQAASRLHPPRLKLEAKAKPRLDINITSVLIDQYVSTKESWMADYCKEDKEIESTKSEDWMGSSVDPPCFGQSLPLVYLRTRSTASLTNLEHQIYARAEVKTPKRRQPFVPFALRNHTGCTLWFATLTTTPTRAALSHSGSPGVVPEGNGTFLDDAHNVSEWREVLTGVSLENFPLCKELLIPPGTQNYMVRMRLYDINRRQLNLTIRIVCRAEGSLKIFISAPYWLINKTGLPLIFRQDNAKTDAAGQFEEHELARSLSPLLFCYADKEQPNLCTMRIGRGIHPEGMPGWCQGFSLDGGSGVRALKVIQQGNRPGLIYNIGIDVKKGRGRYIDTCMVIFAPRYLLDNKSSHKLAFAQREFARGQGTANPEGYISTLPGSSVVFHWPRNDYDQLLCVRLMDVPNCIWSGGFEVNKNNSFHINMRDTLGKCFFLRVEITLRGATYRISFSDTDQLPPPFRIDNFSKVPVVFTQHGVAEPRLRTEVKPMTSLDYAWDEPTLPPFITLTVKGAGSSELNCNMNDFQDNRQLYYENFIYIAATYTFSGLQEGTGRPVASNKAITRAELVLDVSPKTQRVILKKKEPGKRSQLWRMTGTGMLAHEGSSVPHNPSKPSAARSTEGSAILDIAGLAAVTDNRYEPLMLRKPDRRRSTTQTWSFREGKLTCGLHGLVVQAKGGLSGLFDGAEVVLGPDTSMELLGPVPPEQQFINQKMRPGSGMLSIRVIPDGPTRALQITDFCQRKSDRSSYDTDELPVTEQELQKLRNPDTEQELEVLVKLEGGIGLSLINKVPEELVFASLTGINVHYTQLATSHMLELSIQDVQVDNQLIGTTQPFMLYVTPLSNENEVIETGPAVQVNAVKFPSKSALTNIYKHLMVTAQRFTVQIEERLLLKLLSFFGYDQAESEVEKYDENLHEKTAEQGGTPIRYYFENLKISIPQIKLSVFTSNKLPLDLKALKSTLGFPLIRFEDAVINLDPFTRVHPYETKEFIINDILKHFQEELLSQAARILGSVDFLGNPMGLLNDVSEGVTGLIKYGNVGGLIRNVTHGVSNSAAKFAGTLSDGLGKTMDNRHQSEREYIRYHAATSGEHLVAGIHGLAHGIIGGLTSVITSTVEGVKTEGGVSGFISGLGKGLVGTVTKPVAGALDFASETAQAVRDTATLSGPRTQAQRVRKPRCCTGPQGLLPRYNESQAEGQEQLFKLTDNIQDEFFIAVENIDSYCVLISSKAVYFLKSGDYVDREAIFLEVKYDDLYHCLVSKDHGKVYVQVTKKAVNTSSGVSIPGPSHQKPMVHVKSEVLAVKLSQEINYAKSLYYEQQLMLRLSENQEQLELDS